MNEFGIWFQLGVEHILDLKGYDHILFVSILVLSFAFRATKSLLLVITAFTVGHSLSLALSVIKQIHMSAPLIELLIALTILISSLYAVYNYKGKHPASLKIYLLTVILFGLIHGLGFSFLLRSMLDREQSIILPLLYFNLGLEVGQIIIVLAVLGFSLLLVRLTPWSQNYFKLIFACTVSLIAVKITFERLLYFF